MYLCPLTINSTSFKFYEDSELIISCNVEWKQNNIEKITFKLNGTGNYKYQILDINPCKHRKGYKFFMIHLLESEDIDDDQEYEATKHTHLAGIKMNRPNHTAIFHFNIHPELPSGPIIKKCDFNEDQPETKEGSIIIGG